MAKYVIGDVLINDRLSMDDELAVDVGIVIARYNGKIWWSGNNPVYCVEEIENAASRLGGEWYLEFDNINASFIFKRIDNGYWRLVEYFQGAPTKSNHPFRRIRKAIIEFFRW